jgi:dihydroneopterin aldolase
MLLSGFVLSLGYHFIKTQTMNTKKTASPSKKHMRKDIETKIDNAIGHLAQAADKKFRKLIKKASKILADGLHHKPKPVKKATVKKVKKPVAAKPVKKVTVKKTVKKK